MRILTGGVVLLAAYFVVACGGGSGGGESESIERPEIAATAGDGGVLVEWTDVDAAERYTLYHATAGGIQPDNFGIWVSQHDGVMTESATSPHAVEGLDNGTEYFFVVTATSGGQESKPSNEVSAVPQALPMVTGKINDTGITGSGHATLGNQGTCDPAHPAGQDCHYGRDAQAAAGTLTKLGDGNAGFDFTKIANDGSDLPASAELGSGPNDWACTRDNVTGLVWEVKVDDRTHLRHRDHRYSWYDPSSPDGYPGGQNLGVCTGGDCDTTGFVQAVNAVGLCGASDWRMPTPRELQGIVDYARFGPAIDTGYFPNTPLGTGASFWSGAPLAHYKANSSWRVSFQHGTVSVVGRSSGSRVLLVRGGV